MLPILIFFALFVIFPIAYTIYLSFYDYHLLNPSLARMVGIENYVKIFTDPILFRSIGLSLSWVSIACGVKVVLGIIGAVLLNEEYRGRSIIRALVILTWPIPWAMGAMLWGWCYHAHFGLFNGLLFALGLISSPIEFLARPISAFFSIIIIDIWAGVPFMSLVILAGLQTISQDLYDAAAVDGASAVQRFWHVSVKLAKPVILSAALISVIWTFNTFDIIWVLTRGGPLHATETMAISVFLKTFQEHALGLGSAMSTILTAIISAVTIIYVLITRR